MTWGSHLSSRVRCSARCWRQRAPERCCGASAGRPHGALCSPPARWCPTRLRRVGDDGFLWTDVRGPPPFKPQILWAGARFFALGTSHPVLVVGAGPLFSVSPVFGGRTPPILRLERDRRLGGASDILWVLPCPPLGRPVEPSPLPLFL